MAKQRKDRRRKEADAVKMGAVSLPEEFLRRLAQLVPAERLAAVTASFEQPTTPCFRVNRLLTDEKAALKELRALGLAPEPVEWPAGVFRVMLEQRSVLTDSPAAREGRVYVQSPSSAVPVLALEAQPGEEVLDLAAAPGGKTIHLAEQMDNKGRLAAVEAVRGRFFRLQRNLERCGVTIADTYLGDGAGVWHKVPERFDHVLLDVPCTSEGRFHLDNRASFRYWSGKKIREMARKQNKLAISAVHCLKPGGVLVYCTCTLAPEENEAIVSGLLERFGTALEVKEMAEAPGELATGGLREWEGETYDERVSAGTLRVLPDGVREGFFVARLRKVASTV